MNVLVFLLLATLAGLGVGSAGLPVLYMTLVQDLPQLAAQGRGLLFFIFSSGAALLVHAKRTRLLLGYILLMLPLGLLGTLIGFSIAHRLPQALLRTLFGCFLVASGALGLFSKKTKK